SLYSRLNIRLCIHALQFQEEHLNSMSMKPAAGQREFALGKVEPGFPEKTNERSESVSGSI
ncbi:MULTISPECIES: hypothetical protein, partial [Rhizobium/Agrobacterium group]|uniref:hypothetical protein n=1 Tax=Rhizobium/Agrobacterium group TaxID=227290 RepID=UPI001AEC9DC1